MENKVMFVVFSLLIEIFYNLYLWNIIEIINNIWSWQHLKLHIANLQMQKKIKKNLVFWHILHFPDYLKNVGLGDFMYFLFRSTKFIAFS